MSVQKEKFRKAAQEAADKERRRGAWEIYDYEYKLSENDEEAYVRASGSSFEEYQPLASHPTLFLKFAGLADSGEISQEVWRGWVESYGVLGLERHDTVRYLIERYRELGLGLDGLLEELDWLDGLGREYRLYSGSTRGGPRESYGRFVKEAHKANGLLRLYEAATNPDGSDVRFVKRYAEGEGFGPWVKTSKDAKGWALSWAGHVVQEVISEDCYPLLSQAGDQISQGWGFHTLLGAMYLQMSWLMTATEEIRCKWCTRIISFEQPALSLELIGESGNRKPYKPRVDKEFCDRRCKDKWHYQNVTKPKRSRGA